MESMNLQPIQFNNQKKEFPLMPVNSSALQASETLLINIKQNKISNKNTF